MILITNKLNFYYNIVKTNYLNIVNSFSEKKFLEKNYNLLKNTVLKQIHLFSIAVYLTIVNNKRESKKLHVKITKRHKMILITMIWILTIIIN